MRDWSIATTRFTGDEGNVKQAAWRSRRSGAEIRADPGHRILARRRPGAAGHGLHRSGERRIVEQLACSSTRAATSTPMRTTCTIFPGVFAAGDMRRGQSLVVWAIAEGRKAAEGSTPT